ncbi:MAG: SAM-dependent methyltransferase, partial [Hyphomicrobiales bacterium]|nr:SAM-dependent methyltransferase [Hyphomicrobiales bacterium]
MSGFSPDWLALREPADHAARSADLAAQVFAHFTGRDRVTILDLGCGSGSNLRALAEGFPADQTWRLVDWDHALLDAARGALIAWADHAESSGDALHLHKHGKQITVHFQQADLAQNLDAVLDGGADLVTATAFFDLVSPVWIARLCASLAHRKLPLYAILTYDGTEVWQPPHPADAKVLAAFHAHQEGDKGFGPAAGPFAAAHLARVLEEQGYKVETARSDWKLGPESAALIHDLVSGAADAVAETGLVPALDLKSWREA